MSRGEVIRKAMLDYHAGRITLADLLRVVAQWRPKR